MIKGILVCALLAMVAIGGEYSYTETVTLSGLQGMQNRGEAFELLKGNTLTLKMVKWDTPDDTVEWCAQADTDLDISSRSPQN